MDRLHQHAHLEIADLKLRLDDARNEAIKIRGILLAEERHSERVTTWLIVAAILLAFLTPITFSALSDYADIDRQRKVVVQNLHEVEEHLRIVESYPPSPVSASRMYVSPSVVKTLNRGESYQVIDSWPDGVAKVMLQICPVGHTESCSRLSSTIPEPTVDGGINAPSDGGNHDSP